MEPKITAKNMDISPAVEARILRKTAKMERYLKPNTQIYVRLNKTKDGRRICEITVPLIDGAVLRAEADDDDNLYVCIDQALARMERQIHKHRTRLEKQLKENAFTGPDLEFGYDPEDVDDHADVPKVVKYKTFPVRPMHLEDAVMAMELLDHDFYVFVDIDTERTNVLYRRKDGNLGLLQPEA